MIIMLQGKTDEDRLSITSAASEAVDKVGGCILDYKQFSNLAVCFTFELASDCFAQLRRELSDLKIIMEPPFDPELKLSSRSGQTEVMGSLRITFIHEDGDLRIEIPAVPG